MKVSDKSANIWDSMKASAVGGVVQTTTGVAALPVMYAMNKIGKVPNDTVEVLHTAAEKALKESGMDKFGANIKYLNEDSVIVKPLIERLTKFKTQPKQETKFNFLKFITNPIEQVKRGYNAAYVSDVPVLLGDNIKNVILMPEKDIPFGAFHEIGHCINRNASKFWKAMQKSRGGCMAAAIMIGLYGAFSKKSVAKDGQELTKKQKANNFVRDNAGKLSFAAMLPMLAEEAMASIRGQKLANKLLDPKLAKHVLKGNLVAYSSYLITAAALGLGAWAGVKYKDRLVAKRAEKAQTV